MSYAIYWGENMFKNFKIDFIDDNIIRVIRFNNEFTYNSQIIKNEKSDNINPFINFYLDNDGLLHFTFKDAEFLSEAKTNNTISFNLKNESIYGLGMHQDIPFNRRNCHLRMVQENAKITAVPFLTTNSNYALLFDNYGYMNIGIDKEAQNEVLTENIDTKNKPNTLNIWADDDSFFVYYVIFAKNIKSQIKSYRFLTGQAPLFPLWSYGFFQSKEHYKIQKEVLRTLKKLRRKKVSIDCIVQDWNYWGNLGWNAVEWDNKKYPNPKKMIDKIHKNNSHIMVSLWPSFGPQTKICKELENVDGILAANDKEDEHWGRIYDPWNDKAKEIVWKYMYNNLFLNGVDAWWLDSTEPALKSDSSLVLKHCKNSSFMENKKLLNLFAYSTTKNVYDAQRKVTNDKRVFILTRSGFAGQQANATSTWTGDIYATWDVFRKQIPALLSFSLSGIPYSTTDIGGFFVKPAKKTKDFQELYTRWYWFGAFSPLFRSHGTSLAREIWNFDKVYRKSQLKANKLRYSLIPYIYKESFDVYNEGTNLINPLIYSFPNDKKVYNIDNEYMFGSNILVKPITSPNELTTDIYLPDNEEWYDLFTNDLYKGGQKISVSSPIDEIPLFIKAGSVIISCKPEMSTQEQDINNLYINIYSGKSTNTFYYEDELDGYNYEQGNYFKIPIKWNEDEKSLHISKAIGNTYNYNINKNFTIFLNGNKLKTIKYSNEDIDIKL